MAATVLLIMAAASPLAAQMAQQAYVKASNTRAEMRFGWSCAISGDTMVIGAPYEQSASPGVNGDQASTSLQYAGAAYVFVRAANGAWTQQAYLKASDPKQGACFGWAVAISGDLIAVGAYGHEDYKGCVYLFHRTGETWQQERQITASNGEAGDQFGYSLALSGNTLVVGAIGEDSASTGVDGNESSNAASNSGAAYVFTRRLVGIPSVPVWTQSAYLKATNTDAGDRFGTSVALSGNLVVVGAYGEDSAATGADGNQANNDAENTGAAYVYERTEAGWVPAGYLKRPPGTTGLYFGNIVAVTGDTVAATCPSELVAFYRRNGLHWALDGVIATKTLGFVDSLALEEDTLLVGTPLEDGGEPGIRFAPETAPPAGPSYSGAALLYRRVEGQWQRRACLKAAPTLNAADRFGWRVALSGRTAVIGAWGEDSFATGIGGNPYDNTAADSGAAYVFDLGQPGDPFMWITDVQKNGGALDMRFTGPAGIKGWRVMRSDGLDAFGSDITTAFTLAEPTPGHYRATSPNAATGPARFFRIEHD